VPLLISTHRDEPFLDVPDSAWHYTPLHYACCYNNKELIEVLLEAGADQHARYYSLMCANEKLNTLQA